MKCIDGKYSITNTSANLNLMLHHLFTVDLKYFLLFAGLFDLSFWVITRVIRILVLRCIILRGKQIFTHLVASSLFNFSGKKKYC